MTYGEFLAACRKIAEAREGNEISKTAFAKRLKLKRPGHYIGCENDTRKPGLGLLEAAARAAGVDFRDCIREPGAVPVTTREQAAIEQFRRALYAEPLRTTALNFADFLTDGRTKKRS